MIHDFVELVIAIVIEAVRYDQHCLAPVLAFFAGIVSGQIQRIEHRRLPRCHQTVERVDHVVDVTGEFLQKLGLIFELYYRHLVAVASFFDEIG